MNEKPEKKKRQKRAVRPKAELQALPIPFSMPPPAPPESSGKPAYRVDRWNRPQAPNPAMLRNTLAVEGFTVFQWADPPGTVYGMHRHESAQSHWIVSGSLEITVEGRGVFVLGPGDRDMMLAGTYHSARALGDEMVIYLVGEVA